MISKKYTSLSHIQEDLAKDKTSCVELAGYYIAQNKKHAGLNAVLEVFEEETLENAAAMDAKIKAGTAGRLAGMFLAIKDNICYQGHISSSSSKTIGNYEAVYTATALQRLLN